ncbi:MAG TPA: metalloregulator ArsR/SmtB family transcription factor [Fredinandcohnia sp.]|nr:metalloregulator ArsR/SmtB family transcription factor [Fredinandcohnia sp.]
MSKARTALRPNEAAPLFAALGDDTRLRLLDRLATGGPASATALSRDASVTRQAITKHLQVLLRARLVRARREGRERIWELAPERLDLARLYLERISARWDEALESLRAFVEDDETGLGDR